MNTPDSACNSPSDRALQFYRDAIDLLHTCEVPFLLGGGYAFGHYTGIIRDTKDLDLFIRPADARRAQEIYAKAGYRTEVTFTHWLAKVFHADCFVDIIFNSGNGVCPVDESWFEHAVAAEVLGKSVRLAPVEEMIWQKAYIMERERFDGADILHLLRARGERLDWERLLRRFGPHWRVLLSHLVLFGFVYPQDTKTIPAHVLSSLVSKLDDGNAGPSASELCRGTLLSRLQYLPDCQDWGLKDPRLKPAGRMSKEEIFQWTQSGLNERSQAAP